MKSMDFMLTQVFPVGMTAVAHTWRPSPSPVLLDRPLPVQAQQALLLCGSPALALLPFQVMDIPGA